MDYVTTPAMRKLHLAKPGYWHPRGYRDRTACGHVALSESEAQERGNRHLDITTLPKCKLCFG